MGWRGFTARRPLVSAVVLCVVLSVALLVAAGAYLAANPSVGGWSGPFSPGRAGGVGMTGQNELIRTPAGVRFGRSLAVPGAGDAPAGFTLGSVRFSMDVKNLRGWPRPFRQQWTASVNTIVPTTAGPPAQDEQAWRALVAEAIHATPAFTFGGFGDVPAEMLRGADAAQVWRWSALLMNPALRLIHAPLWAAVSILFAVMISAAVGLRMWQRRAMPGRCFRCGYDLRGLATEPCPECGAEREAT